MIMDHAGEPEFRCVICGRRSHEHPNFWHNAWLRLAAAEAKAKDTFWKWYWRLIGVDLLGTFN